ncbi:MAG: hypothetical protein ABW321_00980 [Polyangiales bacterium]
MTDALWQLLGLDLGEPSASLAHTFMLAAAIIVMAGVHADLGDVLATRARGSRARDRVSLPPVPH